MVKRIEAAMEQRIVALDWMSPQTEGKALEKLHAMRNKIGYPDKWRDYSALTIGRSSLFENTKAASIFEAHRWFARLGKPVDRTEWWMTAPTVDAYYSAHMNDVNFPAGILQPPLMDLRLDLAPSYGDTGGTVGHELTHGFDDEGRQYDARGNLTNWCFTMRS